MSEITFEKAILELEKITTELESGKLGLDESMKAYEKGAKLSEFCAKKLKEAELIIDQIENIEG